VSIDSAPTPRPPVAWATIGGAILAALAVLAATSARYGFHRDELYFLMLPPQWGYVDQPPLTPLIAHAAADLFGSSPAGVRVPAMLCVGATILLVALTTRELGGGRAAQAIAAWGYASASVPLVAGHYMVTATVDNLLWAAVLLLVTCALLRDQPRWWLAAGAVVGLAMYNKLLIVMLLLSLLVGLLIMGPRKVLRSPWPWAGAGLAVLVGLPNLIYQATHHFPQLTMAGAIADNGSRIQLIPFQFLLMGVLLLGVIFAGVRGLLVRPQWRAVRAMPIAYAVAVVLTLISGGQIYYPFGLLAYLFVAGAAVVGEQLTRARAARMATYIALNGALTLVIALPVLPVTVVGHTPVVAVNATVGDQVGWPTYVATIGEVYQGLPADERAHAVLLTGNYGEAGAIVHYGSQYGLPSVYSGQNELYFEGPPPASDTTVIAWTEGPDFVRSMFVDCQDMATMDNGVGVDNEEQGSHVLVCQLPAGGWTATWPKLQHFN
jgi:4-amino-4-deoxy-L-arabinose transferase-like glycosyltransferase